MATARIQTRECGQRLQRLPGSLRLCLCRVFLLHEHVALFLCLMVRRLHLLFQRSNALRLPPHLPQRIAELLLQVHAPVIQQGNTVPHHARSAAAAATVTPTGAAAHGAVFLAPQPCASGGWPLQAGMSA